MSKPLRNNSLLSKAVRVFRRSGVEAGSSGRRWDGASSLHAPQQQTLNARGATKARASALYMNTAQGARIVEAWTSALVGKGWQTRALHPDEEIRKSLSSEFEQLTRPILIQLARALVRDGEAFVQMSIMLDGTLRAKLIAADQVDPSLTQDLDNGHRIISGVEFDAEDTVVAYHVYRDPPGSSFVARNEAVRIPASDMLHVFDSLFPGQVRGLSWLAPVLLKMRDRDDASDAMLMQLKVASLITGFIRDADGTAAGLDGEEDGASLNVSLEPGAMRVLPMGTEVSFSQPGQGLSQAIEFLRAQDREIAAGVGLTFESLTGDLGEANYSSARVGILEFRRRAEMLQISLIEGMALRPLWNWWIRARAIAGELPIKDADLKDFLSVRFVAPGWQWVDPKKEVEAEVLAINAGLKSREEAVASRGRDVDEIDAERARDAEVQEQNISKK